MGSLRIRCKCKKTMGRVELNPKQNRGVAGSLFVSVWGNF
jgi:hypothetical protein